jgi:hypothetical protein
MKRRFWWVQVDDPRSANFVWTQLKINTFYQYQKRRSIPLKYDKLDEDFQDKYKKLTNRKTKIENQEQIIKVTSILRGQLPHREMKIFTAADSCHLSQMVAKAVGENAALKKTYKCDIPHKYFSDQFLVNRNEDYKQVRMCNHFMSNY